MVNGIVIRQVLIAVLAVMVIASGIAMTSGIQSGLFVGVPSSCKSTVNIAAPESLDLYIGETSSIDINIIKVQCGISYVRLSLRGMPKEFYRVGPTYVSTIAPAAVPKKFTIYFDIPTDTQEKSYTGSYTLYTNEGTYNLGEVNINIKSLEKPKAIVEATTRVSKIEIPESVAVSTWYAVLFFASLSALILITVEYFAITKKREFGAALKREDVDIYKPLRVQPKKKVEFKTALKKHGKKK